MTTPHLAIRADGGRTMGVGHLARCLALTQAWNYRGGHTTLISEDPPRIWVDRFLAEGATWMEPAPGWEGIGDWMVLDGYHLGDAQALVGKAGSHLLVIDDRGHTGSADADIVLDQNLGAVRDDYPVRLATTDFLLGPRYALLRREFHTRPDREAPVAPRARRLLVTLGGAPSQHNINALSDVLAQPEMRGFEIEYLDGTVNDVAQAMAACDLALSTSGSTCWELCCMGVPSVFVQTADNQVPLARAMSAAGAALDAGFLRERRASEVAGLLRDLASDPDRRRSMANVARRLVDGRGAGRVAARLKADLIELRRAAPGDGRLLFEWANDQAVRAASFSTTPVEWETYLRWLEGHLADPECQLFIASLPGVGPVGQVRFDGAATAEIDVSVAEDHRGKGLDSAIVLAGLRQVFEDPGMDLVIARVKPTNAPSRRTFEEAAFECEGERSADAHTWLQYSRSRQD